MDIQVNGATLGVFTTLLMAVVGALLSVFKLYITSKDDAYNNMAKGKDDAYNNMVKVKDSQIDEIVKTANERYLEIKADRDFWRNEVAETKRNIVTNFDVLKDGISVIRTAVTALAEERRR